MPLLSEAENSDPHVIEPVVDISEGAVPPVVDTPAPNLDEPQPTDPVVAAAEAPVGMADPTPDLVNPPITPPPEAGPIDDQPPPDGTVSAGDPTLQDLYPVAPEPVGVEETDQQIVDAELARILGEDSPLLAQARQEAMRIANARGLQNSSIAAGMAQNNMVAAAMPMAQQNAAQAQERAIRNQAEQQVYNQQVIDGVTRLNEQYLEGTQALDIQQLASQYQLLISTNETAGSFFNGYMNAIGSVMSNPDMTPSQIAEAVNNMGRMLESGLIMIAEINNMDFGEAVEDIVPGAGPPGGPSAPPGGPGTPGTTPDEMDPHALPIGG